MHAFCGFFIWKAVQNLRLVCIVTSYCWWQDIILFFFCALSDSTSSKTGKFDFGPQGGGSKKCGVGCTSRHWGVVSSSHGDPEQEDATSHQAGRSRQWWWGGETLGRGGIMLRLVFPCFAVISFLRGSVMCVFLFKYQVLCLNVFHVLWLTLALYFLHVSLQSSKFVLKSITVTYIPIFMRFIYAYSMCTIWCRQRKKWLVRLGLKCFHRGIRTWGHSWLSFCGADLDRGKSFAPWQDHLHPQSLPKFYSNCFRGHEQYCFYLSPVCSVWIQHDLEETNWSYALRNLSAASELHDTMAKVMLEGPPLQFLGGSLLFWWHQIINVIMPCWFFLMIKRLDK